MNKDYAFDLLVELLRVDKLIGYYPGRDDSDDTVEWYKI